jgi:predicted subunit of tRNA(5-methylaminomethyl-2-thiouridylate) methyltransferase
MDYNPGKTLFCCGSQSDPGIFECAAILRALGNDVTLMECTTFAVAPSKSETSTTNSIDFYDTEIVKEIKESLAQKGVRFIM